MIRHGLDSIDIHQLRFAGHAKGERGSQRQAWVRVKTLAIGKRYTSAAESPLPYPYQVEMGYKFYFFAAFKADS
jgi:hypothetical protein